MSLRETFALRDYLDPGLTGRTLSDARHSASLSEIADQTCLKGRLAELSGRAVLLAVSSQYLSGLVMLEIDGIARRMLLCPPDLNSDHLQALGEDAEIDAVVTDRPDHSVDHYFGFEESHRRQSHLQVLFMLRNLIGIEQVQRQHGGTAGTEEL